MKRLRFIKEVLSNLSYLKQERKSKPKSLPAIDSDELDLAYERLKTAADASDDKLLIKDLDKLKVTADSGRKVGSWSRRFLFGWGVGNAIDEWFRAFDKADEKQPLLQRIPRNETSNVAAKWLWYGFFTTLCASVISLSVAGVTVFFLFKQTYVLNKQTEVLARQEENFRRANNSAQRTQYLSLIHI